VLARILDKVCNFGPAYIIISAGFDTHEADPIAGFKLRTEDYFAIDKQFQSLGIPTLVC
jgi:acetoin utilization deacetylase AcuC-like enzyme